MDKREALEIINDLDIGLYPKEWDALDMAIDALKREVENEKKESE